MDKYEHVVLGVEIHTQIYNTLGKQFNIQIDRQIVNQLRNQLK